MIVAMPEEYYEQAEADGKGKELRLPKRMPEMSHDIILEERQRYAKNR